MSVLRLIMSIYPYLRSAMVRFPLGRAAQDPPVARGAPIIQAGPGRASQEHSPNGSVHHHPDQGPHQQDQQTQNAHDPPATQGVTIDQQGDQQEQIQSREQG